MICLLAPKPQTVIGMAIFQIGISSVWVQKNVISHKIIEQLVSKYTILVDNNSNNTTLFLRYWCPKKLYPVFISIERFIDK